jgi:tryptophan-rich sensory protein
MPSLNWSEWEPIVVAACAAIVVAAAGGLATEIGPWYRALRKPSWQPPDWAFGPAWTLIFTLTAAAGVLGWKAAPDTAWRATLIAAFAANGVLNTVWSFLFFKLRRPDWALKEVVALWLSIAVLIVTVAGLSTVGAWLLVPYLLWVSFAAYLNLTIVRLNRPFGAPAEAGAGVRAAAPSPPR